MKIKAFYRKTHKNFADAIRYRASLKARHRGEQNKITFLKQQNPQFFEPEKLLNDSDSSVRNCLAKILGTNETSSTKLIECLGSLSQGIIERTLGSKPTYKNLIEVACTKLGLPKPLSPYQGEQSIAIHCFKEMYQKLSPTQKEEYEEALRKQGKSLKHLNPSFTPSMISAGAIIAGQMSGFGVYLAASTLVGAITSTIGVTLPFVFYTTMSSAISIFLGPVGWVAVGAMVIGTLFGPDISKVTQGIILIASLRAEKELKWKVSFHEAREQLQSTSRQIQSITCKIVMLGLALLMYWLIVPVLIMLVIVFVVR